MPRRIAQALFFLALVKPFMTLFIGLRVRGRQYLPDRDPFLLIANHASHLDALIVAAPLPLTMRDQLFSVAAGDVFQSMPFTLRAAASISPRMPGPDAEFAK